MNIVVINGRARRPERFTPSRPIRSSAEWPNIAPGIYHYRVGEHALGLIRELGDSEAREMATAFMCGQRHLGTAHVSFVLTARFDRNYWKYREHPRAYAALLMDAAHLSQTLSLVSTDLGLGGTSRSLSTAAISRANWGLTALTRGPAVVGCGVPAAPPAWLDLDFAPGPPH